MPREMKRVVNIANGFKEAEEWDIKQQISMTPQQRFDVLSELITKVYGNELIDIKKCHRQNLNLQVIRKMY